MSEDRSMDELIDRLESATGRDRELDAELHGVLVWPRGGWEAAYVIDGDAPPIQKTRRWVVIRATTEKHRVVVTPPEYTGNMGVAITIVPANHCWCVGTTTADGTYQANVHLLSDSDGHPGTGKTPEGALLAAALRSRLSDINAFTD